MTTCFKPQRKRILLTNWALGFKAGSETWTMTMYDELSRNHDVDVYAPCGNKLIKAGYDKSKEYDLAIINHCLDKVRDWNIRRRILNSHGIFSDLERPKAGADGYVAVSEEIAEKYAEFKPVIIRNPIDHTEFKETKINQGLKNVLYLSNRKAIKGLCEEACRGLNYRHFGGGKDGAREAIAWADLVITVGRGALESLAMGKNVIVFDRFGSDGMLSWDNVFEIRKNNFSGRRFGEKWDVKRLRDEFDKYDPTRNMRPYILKEHNVREIANQYLEWKF